MSKVSIIMPSLNVGKYIKKSIQSVANQTMSDIEILVIDAGSTDGTLEIIEEFASNDSRIKVIHSDIKSYGYQVNLGVAKATGEYIGIVETDDYIEPDMYESLYQMAIENNVDYVKGQGCFEEWLWENDFKTRPIIDYNHVIPEKIIAPCEHPELQYFDFYLWLGLYKKSFIEKIKFNETPGAAFQDVGFAIKCHTMAKSAIYTDKLVYHYRFGTEGTSSVSHKGIGYVLQEYNLNKKYLESIDKSFASAYYKKMFMQVRSRHYQMGYGDGFWKDTLTENNELKDIFRYMIDCDDLKMSQFTAEEWTQLNLFIESPYALYGAITCYIKVQQQKIDIMSSNIIESKGCVLVGTGLKSKYPYALIKRNNLGKILAVCDNSPEKHGMSFYDDEIVSVEEAIQQYSDVYYIVTSRKYGEEIKLQLKSMGIDNDSIFIYNLGEDMSYLN